MKDLEKISAILDYNDSTLELVEQHLGIAEQHTGANGMTTEQVLRAAIVKQTEGLSYHDLEHYLSDSRAFRQFCRLGRGQVESAGINRHRVEGESPLHERGSCPIMAPSHVPVIRVKEVR